MTDKKRLPTAQKIADLKQVVGMLTSMVSGLHERVRSLEQYVEEQRQDQRRQRRYSHGTDNPLRGA